MASTPDKEGQQSPETSDVELIPSEQQQIDVGEFLAKYWDRLLGVVGAVIGSAGAYNVVKGAVESDIQQAELGINYGVAGLGLICIAMIAEMVRESVKARETSERARQEIFDKIDGTDLTGDYKERFKKAVDEALNLED